MAGEHLAISIMIPAFNQDGWVDNLSKAIALAMAGLHVQNR